MIYSNGTYTNAKTQYKCRRDSVVQIRTVLLTSDFGSSTRERDTILTRLTPSQRTAHLVMFKISHGRDPKILTTAAMIENSTLCPNGREVSYLPAWSNVNLHLTHFQNPQILRTISFGHDVIHTPVPFPVRDFLWQWWLWYPLCASVKLHPMTVPWTKRLE